MEQYYGLNQSTIGWLFFVMSIGYVISCQLTNVTLKYIENRRVTTIFLLVNAFSVMMLGPSNILQTNLNLYFTLLGLFGAGVCCAFVAVPIYSELIEATKEELKISDDVVNDIASSISTSAYFLGQMIGFLS